MTLALVSQALIILFVCATAHASLVHPPDTDGTILASSIKPSTKVSAERGPWIFNSIVDSLSKWGTTAHPNGMSIYLATIPQDVLLHHGNSKNETPTVLDWLAFEIEHAEMFTRPFYHPKRPGKDGKHSDGPSGHLAHTDRSSELFHEHPFQQVLSAGGETHQEQSDEVEMGGGWLHTYRTTRPLRFLYVDGMSGDKADTGLFDSQDFLLRGVGWNRTHVSTSVSSDLGENPNDPPLRPGYSQPESSWKPGKPGPGYPRFGDEPQRAQDMCDMATEWGLQGIIRTETPGFEIIKCDFHDGLEQVQSLQRSQRQKGELWPPWKPSNATRKRRLRDLGARRTQIDYSSMVSAFFYPVNLSNPGSDRPDRPRLVNTKPEEMTAIRQFLNTTVAARKDLPVASFGWRDVADLIVRRYGIELKAMNSSVNSLQEMTDRVDFLLEVFIDYAEDNLRDRYAAAKERCSTFYIQNMPVETEVDRLIFAAFNAVNTEICNTLFELRRCSENEDDTSLDDMKRSVEHLMKYLSWSNFEDEVDDSLPLPGRPPYR